jgi:isocitrate/isopropylmalate dehydrogenase
MHPSVQSLPGDGIGVVTRETLRVLRHVAYTRSEIERIARMAFHLARGHRRKQNVRRNERSSHWGSGEASLV